MRAAILWALALALTASAAAQTGVAAVEFDDQTTDGTFVIVQQVTLSNGGFVVIHDERMDMGDAVGSVVGVSAYLGVGTHDDVRVNISIDADTVPDSNVTGGNVTLHAMPHFDSNDNQEFDFVTSEGQDDGAYSAGGAAVIDSARVTFEQEGTVGADRDDEDEDTPGFEIVALVAALAAAVLLVRRRS